MRLAMVRRFSLIAVVVFASLSTGAPSAQAFDAFYGNPFLGSYDYSYAYRLPTPPYFAIFPPVYYGRRYERPYGDSPFASNSRLGGNSSYHIRPKQSPVQWSIGESNVQMNASGIISSSSPTLAPTGTGKHVTIANPYVRNEAVVAGN